MADDLVHATLAAGIVIARQATSVEQIQAAWLDAKIINQPKPTNAAYKAWQQTNGIQATTLKQDAERARMRAAGMANRARSYAR